MLGRIESPQSRQEERPFSHPLPPMDPLVRAAKLSDDPYRALMAPKAIKSQQRIVLKDCSSRSAECLPPWRLSLTAPLDSRRPSRLGLPCAPRV